MNINFDYKKSDSIDFSSGYIFKGKNYRCSFIEFDSLYSNPAKGTERVKLYNFAPKGDIKASTLILHGLGSANVKFILWMGPHLAAAGVNASVLIMPGNYTRVENNSVSGSSFLYPQMERLAQFSEHAIVDIKSSIDFLEQNNLWSKNNALMGYCLGGMLGTVATAVDPRIEQLVLMTTSGNYPLIIHESKAAKFARRLIEKGVTCNYNVHDKDYMYSLYEKELPRVNNMSLSELLNDEDLHPIFKIDPASYAHLLDPKKVTIIDALFDGTLAIEGRKLLYDSLKGATKRIIPVSHVSWLPFEYLLAKYLLHRLNINDPKASKALRHHETFDDPMDILEFIGSTSVDGIKRFFK